MSPRAESPNTGSQHFAAGDRVRVRAWYPPGHVRTPFYTRGRPGEVVAVVGPMPDAERLAYGADGEPAVPLYRVRFCSTDLWPGTAASPETAASEDGVVVDLAEHWLEPRP